jgi:hypothetical protein
MHAGRYLAGAPGAAFDSVAAASSDSRRSKYVVLQDIINMVGRCRLILLKSALKAHMVSALEATI